MQEGQTWWRRGWGILFLVKDDVLFNEIQITTVPNSLIDAQAIEISLARDKIKVLHLYNPVTIITIGHLDYLIQQLRKKITVVGDFNGHHTIWDPFLPAHKIN